MASYPLRGFFPSMRLEGIDPSGSVSYLPLKMGRNIWVVLLNAKLELAQKFVEGCLRTAKFLAV